MISCDEKSENEKTEQEISTEILGTWTISEIKNITQQELSEYKNTPFIKFDKDNVNGTNGCNNYFSSVKKITEKTIELSAIGETKMLCPEMKIPDTFSKSLSEIVTYSIHQKTLTFFNSEEEIILVFTKN
jgi:heat shock protein HslJ